jgi:hypothetical protein
VFRANECSLKELLFSTYFHVDGKPFALESKFSFQDRSRFLERVLDPARLLLIGNRRNLLDKLNFDRAITGGTRG